MSDEHNVFDDFSDSDEPVPVIAEIDGERKQVGQAKLSKQGGYIHAEIDFKSDDEADVQKLLSTGFVNGVSIAEVAPDITDDEAQALMEFPAHDHNPIQHRDGRPPWCNVCGLDITLQTPAKPPWGRHFGTPANPIHED